MRDAVGCVLAVIVSWVEVHTQVLDLIGERNWCGWGVRTTTKLTVTRRSSLIA